MYFYTKNNFLKNSKTRNINCHGKKVHSEISYGKKYFIVSEET